VDGLFVREVSPAKDGIYDKPRQSLGIVAGCHSHRKWGSRWKRGDLFDGKRVAQESEGP